MNLMLLSQFFLSFMCSKAVAASVFKRHMYFILEFPDSYTWSSLLSYHFSFSSSVTNNCVKFDDLSAVPDGLPNMLNQGGYRFRERS